MTGSGRRARRRSRPRVGSSEARTLFGVSCHLPKAEQYRCCERELIAASPTEVANLSGEPNTADRVGAHSPLVQLFQASSFVP